MNIMLLEEVTELYTLYTQTILTKDNAQMLAFIYPPLFYYIPKDPLLKSLNASQKDKSLEISFDNFEIISIDKQYVINEVVYVLFQTTNTTVWKFTEHDIARNRKQRHKQKKNADFEKFIYKGFKERYGESNVSYNEENSSMFAKVTNKLLAIKEENKWYLLEIKSHLLELYQKFLPQDLVSECKSYLPLEIESEPLDTSQQDIIKQDVLSADNLDRVYLAGWEISFNDKQQFENFVITQATDKETILAIYSGTELVFEDKKLIQAYEYTNGEGKEIALQKHELGLPLPAFEPHRIVQLVEASEGLHQLGGEVPANFVLPEANCIVPFQYLGYINNEDVNFQWLPFQLHLTCPIYLNIQNVLLDYSDPLHPLVLNKDELERVDTSYDDLDQNTEIVFHEMAFDFVESFDPFGDGYAGIPNWVQYPEYPICPKTGKLMRFLCQLDGGIKTKRTNVTPEKEWDRKYYETLNFWGDGTLYVFFEPTSRVACYFIQNT
ncbi:hypothetical protein QNI19_29415 [Cytophagaceae bacterium DM2B3-1]|uniref:DUF1963 domain-containing protein n=1 Tax=Xanthocytophaga flava TaxID=3048013 RepID=A0ABT7CTN9_9BACT|nr:hypothetical protein [Xanthocytophaga flavus]MDJ1497093.1 hypothetical protein [Xanthocytophaga flavus]